MTDTPAFGRRGAAPGAFAPRTFSPQAAPGAWEDLPVRKGGGGAPTRAPDAVYRAEEGPRALDFPTTKALFCFPWLTLLMVTVMAAIFWVEAGGLGGGALDMDPTSTRLRAMGGFSALTVIQHGEYWRLLTAPLLHANLGHIVGNCVIFLVCGALLEGLIGRAWYGAIFVVGGIGGCAASLLMSAHFKVGIGASGAIMALLTAIYVCSFHTEAIFSARRMRRTVYFNAIPALIPFAGSSTDYSAHFGGAVAGMAMGFVLMAVWGENQTKPGQRAIGAGIGVAGLIGAVVAFGLVSLNFARWNVDDPRLAPENALRGKTAEVARRSPVLVLQYPHDPRVRFYHAMALYEAGDVAGMEADLRAALAEPELLAEETPPEFQPTLRLLLAASVDAQGRRAEAKALIAPVCDTAFSNPAAKQLLRAARQDGLCRAGAAPAR